MRTHFVLLSNYRTGVRALATALLELCAGLTSRLTLEAHLHASPCSLCDYLQSLLLLAVFVFSQVGAFVRSFRHSVTLKNLLSLLLTALPQPV